MEEKHVQRQELGKNEAWEEDKERKVNLKKARGFRRRMGARWKESKDSLRDGEQIMRSGGERGRQERRD